MDTPVKHRLIGAIVLIALVVIFVPMFLSRPGPQSTSDRIDLSIPPPPDEEFQNRVLPVGPGSGAAPAATPGAAAVATPLPEKAAPPVTATSPDVAAPAGTPAKATSAPPVATKAAEPAPPSAAASPPAAPVPVGTAAEGHWYVQLGVYAQQKNADDLVASLKKAGFPGASATTDYHGKPAQRVTAGPYPDRAAAEAARLKIRQAHPSVPSSVTEVATSVATDAPSSAIPAGRAGGWAVQVAAYRTAADADALRLKLRKAGFTAFVDKAATAEATWWRVRVGPEADRGNAEKLKAALKDKAKLDGVVVTM